jgi:sulfite reductase (ferredoxin)
MSIEPTHPPPSKRSAVELIKENSRQLRGSIAEELAADSDHFNDQNKQLIKFHGFYQQDDRDARKDRHREKAGKSYMFMVRCKIPGGKVSAEQYLAIDALSENYANGTLRITTRQGFQLHGVLKKNLKKTIAQINGCLLSTLGACGDVERNVMAPPAPFATPVYNRLQDTAERIAKHLAPRTGAYHEIWLNGEAVHDVPPAPEPIYGKVYLPRKFKTGLALPEDNSVDIYAQDLGLLAVVENGQVAGYNVLVGGGMGMTHGNEQTFPYVGKAICYVPADQEIHAVEAVVKLFRDHGNRGDRKRARIKYVVHDWGVEKFRQVLAGYLPFPLVLPRPIEVTQAPLHLGWHPQGDGKFFYGISVESGRIKDEGSMRLRTCLRTLVERLKPAVRLTPSQDIFLCNLDSTAKADVERTLAEHGVPAPRSLTPLRQYGLACPAIPTCGLALSEAERVMPDLVGAFENALAEIGLQNETISLRMTGCPNGCARPYQSDIGIVGRSGDKYSVFVGGSVLGHRLNFMFKDLVPFADIVSVMMPLLKDFKKNRQGSESFGDYCHRLGQEKLQQIE